MQGMGCSAGCCQFFCMLRLAARRTRPGRKRGTLASTRAMNASTPDPSRYVLAPCCSVGTPDYLAPELLGSGDITVLKERQTGRWAHAVHAVQGGQLVPLRERTGMDIALQVSWRQLGFTNSPPLFLSLSC